MGKFINLIEHKVILASFPDNTNVDMIDDLSQEIKDVYYPMINDMPNYPNTIIDFSNLPVNIIITSEARKKLVEAIKPIADIPTKIALVNMKTYTKITMDVILKITNMQDEFKHFINIEDAMKWVRE